VCPLVIVFEGQDAIGKVLQIECVGPSAVDFKDRYSRLLSRNGIEYDGGDRLLDNEVQSKSGHIIFNQSNVETQVEVPMLRHDRASCVKVRPPTPQELDVFMKSNPQLHDWTVEAMMEGTINLKKLTVRGRAHDALPHLGNAQMDRLSMIEGMRGAVPLSGQDLKADEEIHDCEGCKAKQPAPARRNSKKPTPVEPGDVAVDIQQYPVKQVGTTALYGTVSVLLYYALPLYETHGSEKRGFEDTMEAIRVCANRLQRIDIRKGRIFCSLGAGDETVDLEDAEGNDFNHVISDHDSQGRQCHQRF
jgi:hypothetical protein